MKLFLNNVIKINRFAKNVQVNNIKNYLLNTLRFGGPTKHEFLKCCAQKIFWLHVLRLFFLSSTCAITPILPIFISSLLMFRIFFLFPKNECNFDQSRKKLDGVSAVLFVIIIYYVDYTQFFLQE